MPVSYLPDHANWEEARVNSLYAADGFLNLAGLFWLDPGEYSFGSGGENDLGFPQSLPESMGKLFVTRNRVLFIPQSEVPVKVDGRVATESVVVYDEGNGQMAEMSLGSHVWFVIERVGNLGVRLRDLEHPSLAEELDIPKFPVDYKWVVDATFVPYDKPKIVMINNVVGFTYPMKIPGQLRFELAGEDLTLEPIIEGDQFFIIFSDNTSAVDTYGSGRYMYSLQPDEDGKVVLDFNKCYNPPCAFTEFATCLIPPRENRLTVAIEAGEKDFHMPQ